MRRAIGRAHVIFHSETNDVRVFTLNVSKIASLSSYNLYKKTRRSELYVSMNVKKHAKLG